MKKINLLTTGLATTCTETFKIRNIDYFWLINNPSILLWADNIFLTKYMADSILNKDNTPFDKSLKLIVEILEDYGIIKFKNSKNIFNNQISKKLDKIIEKDLSLLEKNNDLSIIDEVSDDDHRNLRIGENVYCFPELRSIYASLLISEKWDATCLFSKSALDFLNYKMDNPINGEFQSTINSFEDVFSLHLPDINLIPYDILLNQCPTCVIENNCNYQLDKIEDNLTNYLDVRDYDEIGQIKNMIYKINKEINSKNQFSDSGEILKEYNNQRNQIRKSMYTTFPKVRKWTNYSMVAMSSVAGLGFLTGSNILTGIGIGLDFLGATIYAELDRRENKNRWVSFKLDDIIFK